LQTIGFRCAQDLPVAEQASSCGKPLCGSFNPPAAFTSLSEGAADWAAWGVPGTGGGATRGSAGSGAISAVISVNSTLKQCNLLHQQVSYSWTGANVTGRGNATEANLTAVGVCQTDGDGMNLHVTPGQAGKHTLRLYAGTQAGSHAINATLTDGGKSTLYSELLPGVAADLATNVWNNVRWDLVFETTAADAVLMVHLAVHQSNGHYAPLPAPPPLPACTQPLCGSISPFAGKVDLSAVGTAGWAHYGNLKVAQTIQGKPLPYAATGASVPSDPKAKSDWALAGGATFIGSETTGLTDLRSGGPNGKAVATLTSHLEGAGHNIEGVSMAFRYISGYGCTPFPCPGAPVVTVVLVDATTMSDIATIYTSPPLGNYSFGNFKGYSPPVEVAVSGLNVSNANPVLVQLRIENN